MGVSVKCATVEHAEAILGLYSALSPEDIYTRFLGFHRISKEEIVHAIENSIVTLIAESDGAVIAEVTLHRDGEFSVVVHPGYRSLGIGTHLVKRAIEAASQAGLREVHFYTLPDNLPMLRIGARLGFSLSFLGGEAHGSLVLRSEAEKEARPAAK